MKMWWFRIVLRMICTSKTFPRQVEQTGWHHNLCALFFPRKLWPNRMNKWFFLSRHRFIFDALVARRGGSRRQKLRVRQGNWINFRHHVSCLLVTCHSWNDFPIHSRSSSLEILVSICFRPKVFADTNMIIWCINSKFSLFGSVLLTLLVRCGKATDIYELYWKENNSRWKCHAYDSRHFSMLRAACRRYGPRLVHPVHEVWNDNAPTECQTCIIVLNKYSKMIMVGLLRIWWRLVVEFDLNTLATKSVGPLYHISNYYHSLQCSALEHLTHTYVLSHSPHPSSIFLRWSMRCALKQINFDVYAKIGLKA